MSMQNLITPVIHHDVPLEANDVEQEGSIHADTAAFLVVLVGFVAALVAALV
jgi:hypothetical protein